METKKKQNQCEQPITCDATVADDDHVFDDAVLMSSLDVPYVPVTVDENNIIFGAQEVLKTIRPNWNMNEVKFKLFTDGITNKLIGCFHRYENSPSNAEDTVGDVVLIRVYGNHTDLLIDRKAETRNIKLLHSYDLAPSLYAIFQNGLSYEYVPGCTLTPETVIKPEIWILIAQKMAEMHKVNPSWPEKTPMLLTRMQKFLDLVPNKFSDLRKHQKLEEMFLPVSKLREEFNKLYAVLEKLNNPVVFSHNDLLLGNVIYNKHRNRVTFIDYEYADFNFQAFDIGNHFTEFAGIDEIDFSRYPTREFQMEWLSVYLKSYHGTEDINMKEVEKVFVAVNQFALASHFFWAVWALIQAEHSTIDFDFVKFAESRFCEYLRKKDTFLALKCKQ